ncbi:hypothetical protein [Dyadobacter pollutisoli]|jgi:hypothetical protein|uniref:Uncharacterized protein n=1 Tax=Dyadobacter pollutisoli TaxID=2910158 RepID=A0A9E8SPG5_9BACT|nr:hypothetical protein [Dyadobacter pollutisoli]WAC11882.1 hypothetical protein ON006_29645 [Dyadobacter pollutisoli]
MFTKKEVDAMKANGMRESASRANSFVGTQGTVSRTTQNKTVFHNGDMKRNISLERLNEMTKK